MKPNRNSRVSLLTTRRVPAGGAAWLVALDGPVAAVCMGAVIDAGLRCVILSDARDAYARLARDQPRVVFVTETTRPGERTQLAIAARLYHVQLVELHAGDGHADIAHALESALARSASGIVEAVSLPAARAAPAARPPTTNVDHDIPTPPTQRACPKSIRKRSAAR